VDAAMTIALSRFPQRERCAVYRRRRLITAGDDIAWVPQLSHRPESDQTWSRSTARHPRVRMAAIAALVPELPEVGDLASTIHWDGRRSGLRCLFGIVIGLR